MSLPMVLKGDEALRRPAGAPILPPGLQTGELGCGPSSSGVNITPNVEHRVERCVRVGEILGVGLAKRLVNRAGPGAPPRSRRGAY
jgi:hypothetical protein